MTTCPHCGSTEHADSPYDSGMTMFGRRLIFDCRKSKDELWSIKLPDDGSVVPGFRAYTESDSPDPKGEGYFTITDVQVDDDKATVRMEEET